MPIPLPGQRAAQRPDRAALHAARALGRAAAATATATMTEAITTTWQGARWTLTDPPTGVRASDGLGGGEVWVCEATGETASVLPGSRPDIEEGI